MIDALVALRLHETPQIALVGSGGKTTWMIKLARAYRLKHDTVFLTTTTHLASWQLNFADHHQVITDPTDLPADVRDLPPGIVLFTGAEIPGERVSGLDAGLVRLVQELSHKGDLPLLIEADGSRQRPLKAPASYEPVIPDLIDGVIVMAGMRGLNQPLDEQHVHRPEIFSVLSGIPLGEKVSVHGLSRVLMDPNGGLKNIPDEARRIALLNQTEGPIKKSIAGSLAEMLLPTYDGVLLGETSPGSVSGSGLSAAEILESDIEASRLVAAIERKAGIILAAGGSSRFTGGLKQLLNWEGVPLVRHVAQTAIDAGLSPVIVVVGAEARIVEAALDGLSVTIVHNSKWEAGQSTSIRAGLKSLSSEAGAAMFLLVDQPHIPVTLMRALLETHEKTLAPVVAPLIDEDRGNPVLFDRRTFPEFTRLEGDVGGRAIFSRFRVSWVPWHDDRMRLDIDTESDYWHLLEVMGIEPSSKGSLELNEG